MALRRTKAAPAEPACGHTDCANSPALARACMIASRLEKPYGLSPNGQTAHGVILDTLRQLGAFARHSPYDRVFWAPGPRHPMSLLTVLYTSIDIADFFRTPRTASSILHHDERSPRAVAMGVALDDIDVHAVDHGSYASIMEGKGAPWPRG